MEDRDTVAQSLCTKNVLEIAVNNDDVAVQEDHF